jgi:hypothetical protein
VIDALDPFDGRPYRHRVGLRPLHPAEWLMVDSAAAADVGEKERLLGTVRGDVCGALPGSEGACEELLGAIEDDLRAFHPAWWRARAGAGTASGADAIERCGLLTQEDWCVLEGEPPVLRAGSVSFPNGWRLRENLGRPLRGIHEPVPRYDEQLGDAADHALSRVTPERPVWRLNWSLLDDHRLHRPWPQSDPVSRQLACADVGARVHLRQERQTLIRLPRTGALVFGIRTFIRPLGLALATADRRRQAAVVLRTLPADVAAYKCVADLREPVLAWLEAQD